MKKKDLDNCKKIIDELLNYEAILSIDKDTGKFYFRVEKRSSNEYLEYLDILSTLINLVDKRFFDVKHEEEILNVLPKEYLKLLNDEERQILYYWSEGKSDSYIINKKRLMKLCEKINITLSDTNIRMVLLPILKTEENIKMLDIKYKFLRKTSTIIIKIKNSEIYNYLIHKLHSKYGG